MVIYKQEIKEEENGSSAVFCSFTL